MAFHQAYIAGVRFRPGAAPLIASFEPGKRLDLEPDPSNQHDLNAVKVMYDGLHIGYVPRDLSADVAKLIREGRCSYVRFVGGTRIEIHYDLPKEAIA